MMSILTSEVWRGGCARGSGRKERGESGGRRLGMFMVIFMRGLHLEKKVWWEERGGHAIACHLL